MNTAEATTVAAPSFDVDRIRQDFPILARMIREHRLVYLDNAATTQKPKLVLDTLSRYYSAGNANIHRGLHTLADEATAAFEGVRTTVQRHLNAFEPREIVFTRGTTEAINLVATCWAGSQLKPGDRILSIAYGSGAGSDGFDITITDHIKNLDRSVTVEQMISRMKIINYPTYAKYRGKIHMGSGG